MQASRQLEETQKQYVRNCGQSACSRREVQWTERGKRERVKERKMNGSNKNQEKKAKRAETWMVFSYRTWSKARQAIIGIWRTCYKPRATDTEVNTPNFNGRWIALFPTHLPFFPLSPKFRLGRCLGQQSIWKINHIRLRSPLSVNSFEICLCRVPLRACIG